MHPSVVPPVAIETGREREEGRKVYSSFSPKSYSLIDNCFVREEWSLLPHVPDLTGTFQLLVLLDMQSVESDSEQQCLQSVDRLSAQQPALIQV